MDWAQMGVDAAKGAAAGSVVPGIGTALGAAGGVALDLAPELGQWLFGPGAGTTVAAVQTAVQAVTGSDDAGVQLQALTDPDLARTLRVQLAGIAAARSVAASKSAQDQLMARLADVANARATTVQLAQSHSPLSWGAAIVSVVVLTTFAGVMIMSLLRTIPESAAPVVNVLLGSLTTMATSVVSYWVGSSIGSVRKDAKIANLQGQIR
ncbi:MAG: hypothetical protein ACRYF2_05285 [Janthinobacterium lividum]